MELQHCSRQDWEEASQFELIKRKSITGEREKGFETGTGKNGKEGKGWGGGEWERVGGWDGGKRGWAEGERGSYTIWEDVSENIDLC